MMSQRIACFFLIAASLYFVTNVAFAAPVGCKDLPGHADFKKALTDARKQDNGGLNHDMWGAVVDRSGIVCTVAFSGKQVGDQWPGSRVIAAQKANTANSFSLVDAVLSTANLFTGAQPGGFLFGIQESNPVNTVVAYRGEATQFGSPKDPMLGERIGGVNVFGGGLALYDKDGTLLGGLGVSGDTSCADHNIAWRTRAALELDYIPPGVAKDKTDQIIYDIHLTKSTSGFGHPICVGSEEKISKSLAKVRTVVKK